MDQKIKNLKTNYKLSENVLIFHLTDKIVRLYNIDNRFNYITESFFLLKLKNSNLSNTELSKKIIFSEVTEFNLWNDMYSNPDFFKKKKISYEKKSIKNALEILKNTNFFTNKKYSKNFLQRFEGNINSQLGKESLFRRHKLSDWWINQKYKKGNLKELKNNIYKFVQEDFIRKYSMKNLKNKKVLEIGCGHGFYSNIFSNYAKHVDAFDYEKKYIDLARELYPSKKINFYIKNIINMDFVSKKKYDYIFLIDVYLFFFDDKYQKKLFENKNKILGNIKKLLNKNGKLIIIDPHNFWLTPRFGNKTNPFGIISEYNNPKFTSLPNLSKRLEPLFKNGFKLIDLIEPKPNEISSKYLNTLDYNFILEFPQWYCFVLKI